MDKAKANNRINYLDIAKGLAMICIIAGHLGVRAIIRVVFTFHVPIFFLISGYLINEKKELLPFIKDRAKRLLIPYYITCLVIIIIDTISAIFNKYQNATLLYWIKASFYAAGSTHFKPFHIAPIGAIWFLWALFWSNLFLKLSLKMNKPFRLLFVIALFLFGYYTRNVVWLPLSIQPGACGTLFMYVGYLVKTYKNKTNNLPKITIPLFSLIALITTILFIKNFTTFSLVKCEIGRGVIDIFGSICVSWIVILIARFIDKHTKQIKKIFTYFGKNSLILLCVHMVELVLFPWIVISFICAEIGIPQELDIVFIFIFKLLLDLYLTYVISDKILNKRRAKLERS